MLSGEPSLLSDVVPLVAHTTEPTTCSVPSDVPSPVVAETLNADTAGTAVLPIVVSEPDALTVPAAHLSFAVVPASRELQPESVLDTLSLMSMVPTQSLAVDDLLVHPRTQLTREIS